ncbi:MAG: Stk1 family PASTA domain-containing Ser/Thr kinase [Erysipelotrichaceae bacterium]|nr:Stk1 family PASTA domain-containing Ser/Thr kinase [Erysipelotrichaceae bacterium]
MSNTIGNRYEIMKLLGRGGMADVYLAFDVILNRHVAVKIMKSDMADDDLARERFRREAEAVTQLSHPNIVDVYDVGEDGDRNYIVMEYVKGYTLKQLIKKRGPIPYKEAVWMMKQLAGALMEAHRNNVIHRDVKSQNVLIKDDGTIKLSDFGIALANGSIQITHEDSVIGSVHYLAPELSKGKQATMQSDIYSLGIVFYELLSGDVPFKGDTPVQVALKHIKQEIPSVRSMNPDIPQSVENIVIKATAKNLNNRYKNIALMLKDLNDCLKKEHRNDQKITFENASIPRKSSDIYIARKEPAKEKKQKAFSYIFLSLVGLLSISAVVIVLFLSGLIGNRTRMVKVPDLRNMSVQAARDILAEKGLEVDDSRITWILSDSVAKDLIIESNPTYDEEVEVGSKIKLTVSNGLYSTLYNYVGWDYKDARNELYSLNFNVKVIAVESDETPGKVLKQDPESGFKYDPNVKNTITLEYSQEKIVIISYELKGMSIDQAVSYFNENNIKYSLENKDRSFFNEDELNDSAVDTVIKTDPELGSAINLSEDITVKVYYYGE